jgi:hypothetical protein|uniref:Putative signal peptide protein n=2 Tax=Ralstonia pickettii TaxID=329 RepID=C6BM30_RALP1
MHSRTLIAAIASAALTFGTTVAVAQSTTPPAPAADGQSAVPAAGAAEAHASTGKPMHRKSRHHKTSKAKGGANSAGDMSHSGVQSGGNEAATTTGNSQPATSRQDQ